MVDYTKITVSKNGKYLFATEQGHLTYPLEAKVIYKLLKEKFPESEGYKVDVMMWLYKNRSTEIISWWYR